MELSLRVILPVYVGSVDLGERADADGVKGKEKMFKCQQRKIYCCVLFIFEVRTIRKEMARRDTTATMNFIWKELEFLAVRNSWCYPQSVFLSLKWISIQMQSAFSNVMSGQVENQDEEPYVVEGFTAWGVTLRKGFLGDEHPISLHLNDNELPPTEGASCNILKCLGWRDCSQDHQIVRVFFYMSVCTWNHSSSSATHSHLHLHRHWECVLKWTHMNDISLHHHHHHHIQMWTCNSTSAVGTTSCHVEVYEIWIICKFNVSLIYRHIVIQMFHLIRIWSAPAETTFLHLKHELLSQGGNQVFPRHQPLFLSLSLSPSD